MIIFSAAHFAVTNSKQQISLNDYPDYYLDSFQSAVFSPFLAIFLILLYCLNLYSPYLYYIHQLLFIFYLLSFIIYI
jgi:hypothetical protein